MIAEPDQAIHSWQRDIFASLTAAKISHVGYVPDGGHKGLIQLCQQSSAMGTTVLTTEEEGIGLSAGLALGGVRSALLMQSSGVGNCINMFSLAESCRFPLVLFITMRGEWAEFVPWQIPMGKRTANILAELDFDIFRVEQAGDAAPFSQAALDHAFQADRRVAVILAQRLIGRKNWQK